MTVGNTRAGGKALTKVEIQEIVKAAVAADPRRVRERVAALEKRGGATTRPTQEQLGALVEQLYDLHQHIAKREFQLGLRASVPVRKSGMTPRQMLAEIEAENAVRKGARRSRWAGVL